MKKRRRKMTALQLKYFGPRRARKAKAARKARRRRNPIAQPKAFRLVAVNHAGTVRMNFTGTKFSSNQKPRKFASQAAAITRGRSLLAQYPALRRYELRVEDARKPLPKR